MATAVHILFLDESGKPSDKTFAVGGVAVAADCWAELRARWEAEGTPYQRLDRIVDALFLGPSHYSVGLQAADLVVASTLAANGGQLADASRWHKQAAGAIRAAPGHRQGRGRRAEGVSQSNRCGGLGSQAVHGLTDALVRAATTLESPASAADSPAWTWSC